MHQQFSNITAVVVLKYNPESSWSLRPRQDQVQMQMRLWQEHDHQKKKVIRPVEYYNTLNG